MGWRESISLPLRIPLNEEVVESVDHHEIFHGLDHPPVAILGAAFPQLQSCSSGGNWESCVLLGQGQWPCKASHRATALQGWLIWGCTCDLSYQRTPLNSDSSEFFSLLGDALGYKTLGQVAWTPSLGVEALRKKVVRLRPQRRGKGKSKGGKERTDDFWFLGSSHRSLYLLWFLCPGFQESFQWVSHFLEASWSWAPLNFYSDLILDT